MLHTPNKDRSSRIMTHVSSTLADESSSCGRNKLIALCHSVVMHQLRLSCSDAAEQTALKAAMLRDLQLAARRISQDGLSAVCDDPSHVEWLSDTAWNIACDLLVPDQASTLPDVALCAGFLSMAYAFSEALPASEARLRLQLRAQSLICRCHLSLAGEMDPGTQATAVMQEHLLTASTSIQLSFRHAARLGQSPEGSAKPEGEDLGPMMQLLNFEVSLRRGDPNLKQLLARVAEADGTTAEHLRYSCPALLLQMVTLDDLALGRAQPNR